MEIKLTGQGNDENRSVVLRTVPFTEAEIKKAWSPEGDEEYPYTKYYIVIGEESIRVDGAELRRAAIALCPAEGLADQILTM